MSQYKEPSKWMLLNPFVWIWVGIKQMQKHETETDAIGTGLAMVSAGIGIIVFPLIIVSSIVEARNLHPCSPLELRCEK